MKNHKENCPVEISEKYKPDPRTFFIRQSVICTCPKEIKPPIKEKEIKKPN